ncbi:MAG: AAA family ATPase [Candidatus Omnitrophica bacterium]|nr:AAA family ATPase [Candidatus Omnitrophota bacterium]
MSSVIVIAGKGGTGKTTVCALITLMLAHRAGARVLAVDADPNSNLSDALGLSAVGTIADIIEEVAKKPDIVPQSMGKDSFIEYKIHNDITENDGFDLLVMGRPEGPGCYCYINNVLRNVMAKLVSDYTFVVIDNEAGMEHFSRKTTRAADNVILVTDESQVGLRSAKRILGLIEELGIVAKKKFLVVNRSSGSLDIIEARREFAVDDVFVVPFDKDVQDLSSKGLDLASLSKSCAAYLAIQDMGDKLWPKN